MAQLLILSPAADDDVLPALTLLSHRRRVIPASPEQLITAPESDLIFLDARTNLAGAKSLAQILRTTGL
ncbi:MAG: DNA-binding response regulator, partial [Actinomycetota bacterium]|nr:DNA-binding response regulator [Actinomycetota bacterium]